ncbi:hypothetical protein GCM10009838_00760 [Catenulispora subtropica]|uniref:Uncharacterized protein n=1 Tax=Catenulispora subtropica TaxID=450798 RepID=A0ABP5BR41_9ACTN
MTLPPRDFTADLEAAGGRSTHPVRDRDAKFSGCGPGLGFGMCDPAFGYGRARATILLMRASACGGPSGGRSRRTSGHEFQFPPELCLLRITLPTLVLTFLF